MAKKRKADHLPSAAEEKEHGCLFSNENELTKYKKQPQNEKVKQ